MANKVEICGVDTARLPLYKEAEMTEMLERIKNGDTSVREKFINGNLRLVLSVIQRFANRGENPDDLFQVGCIGLIKALENFDLKHGVKFSTYAERIVINGLRTYCRLMCSKQKHHILLPVQKDHDDEAFSLDQLPAEDTLERLLEEQDIYMLLQSVKRQYSGTIRLGIEAIEWKVKGLSGAEIAKMYGVKPNLVGAWIARAASRLKKNSDLMEYFDQSVEIDSS